MEAGAHVPSDGATTVLPAHLARWSDSGAWINRTIAQLGEEWLADDPAAIAFIEGGRSYTIDDIVRDARQLAAALQCRGVGAGTVMSMQAPNWVETAVINLAASMVAAVINPIVPIFRDAEVRQMLSDSRTHVFFCPEEYRGYSYREMVERLGPELPDLQEVIYLRPGSADLSSFADLLAAGSTSSFEPAPQDPDVLKLILYTSGTTGRPKCVMHNHNTLATAQLSGADAWRIAAGDTVLMPSPVTHISGYSNGLELPFLRRTTTVLMDKWDASLAVELIETHSIRAINAATPFLKELLDAAHGAGTCLPSLSAFACGGASVPAELVRDANDYFANPCAFRVYGSSEVPLVTVGHTSRVDLQLACDTDGRICNYDVLILDENGSALPDGCEGEIAARGPSMFMGYMNDADNREAFTDDGFFKTGDIGRIDQCYITVMGRIKDLIIRGGENISAREIEDVLLRHPDIEDVAIVSMPHQRLGEGICAYVVSPIVLDVAMLAKFLDKAGLAKQKWPERVMVLPDLPKTASGKVRKDVLRQMARETVMGDGTT